MSRSYQVKAIVLKTLNFSESDRLLTLFSQEKGKITALAKGVRKINSKRSGHLQTFTQVSVQISQTKGLGIITQAKSLNSFKTISSKLNLSQMAFTACELVNLLTPEGQPSQELYTLLARFLIHLNTGKPIKNAIFEFQKKLLKISGFGVPNKSTPQSLQAFIEEIVGRPLKSPEINI